MRKIKSPRFYGPRGLRRVLRRFRRGQDGAAAVEFGLVAVPFFALLFAIIETALVFFAGQALETAAASASRLIFTGQAQNLSAATFKTQVCNRLNALFNCANGLSVDVKIYDSFSSINLAAPVVNGQLDTGSMGYSAGGPSSIVVMRLYYQWPIYVSLLNPGITDIGDGKKLLVATSVFRNEPY